MGWILCALTLMQHLISQMAGIFFFYFQVFEKTLLHVDHSGVVVVFFFGGPVSIPGQFVLVL